MRRPYPQPSSTHRRVVTGPSTTTITVTPTTTITATTTTTTERWTIIWKWWWRAPSAVAATDRPAVEEAGITRKTRSKPGPRPNATNCALGTVAWTRAATRTSRAMGTASDVAVPRGPRDTSRGCATVAKKPKMSSSGRSTQCRLWELCPFTTVHPHTTLLVSL